jgi:branched-chain amino acid transport system substrate-binding protein
MTRNALFTLVFSVPCFFAVALAPSARAQISDDVVKIGVLNDMSSLYADATGRGSLTAAR